MTAIALTLLCGATALVLPDAVVGLCRYMARRSRTWIR